MSTGELNTTSFAILGLLAVRPCSTYELARQMDRAIGWFWPRTRSKLYEEPKRLAAEGFARATREMVGRRPRTVYSITPKGRRALAAWVKTPGEGPVVEFEQLVKVFFAEHGSKQDLLRGLDGVRAWLEDRARRSVGIPHDYLDGRGTYPERLPWLVLTGRFLDELDQAIERWLDWATAEVASWPDDIEEAEPAWDTLREMAARLDRIIAASTAVPDAAAGSGT